jgi:hypothetical protein
MWVPTSWASVIPSASRNLEEDRASQRKLASLSFDAAGFDHGAPITCDASMRFRSKWLEKLPT